MPNMTRLKDALTAIKEDPAHWDQGDWVRHDAAGEATMCLGGRVMAQAGMVFHFTPVYGTTSYRAIGVFGIDGSSSVQPFHMVMELLELTRAQTLWLTCIFRSIEDFDLFVKEHEAGCPPDWYPGLDRPRGFSEVPFPGGPPSPGRPEVVEPEAARELVNA